MAVPNSTNAVTSALREAATLAVDSIRSQPARSALAIVGVVIGIVTVVLVSSTLVGLRNSVALLFRELGTENIFAFHVSGEPYSAGSSQEVNRPTLKPAFAPRMTELGPAIRDVGIEVIVPAVTSTRAITARAGSNESDSLLIEGISPNFYDIVGAEFAAGRPFTDYEERARAQVAVLGASVARALFGREPSVGKSFLLERRHATYRGRRARGRARARSSARTGSDTVLAMPVGTLHG
jgi:putative ABC transport system permease protein